MMMKNQGARRSRRGLTLIELMIGMAIALFLTAAAVTFVRHETRLLGVSQDRVDMLQSGRAAINLLADDLRGAGQGIGYDENGDFQGLLLGTFVAGTQTFNTNGTNRTITLNNTANGSVIGAPWNSNVVDIGIRSASGIYRTIADWDNATLEFCARDDDADGSPDAGYQDGDTVVMREAPGIAALTVTLSAIGAPGGCGYGVCSYGCVTANWVPAATQVFNSGPSANAVSYIGGELGGTVRTIVWFVVADAAGWGTLQRQAFANDACGALDDTCGGTVAQGVETLQMQVWQWDQTTATWNNVGTGPITTTGRLRVDVEMVVRADGTDDRLHSVVPLRLQPGACVPEPCGAPVDSTERRPYRTSVEIKNSGYMSIK